MADGPGGHAGRHSTLGVRDLVFPEGAALAFGIIGLRLERLGPVASPDHDHPSRRRRHGRRPCPRSRAYLLLRIAALTCALVMLRVLVRLSPQVISAAVLPVVFAVRAWSFVAAVAAIAAVLAP